MRSAFENEERLWRIINFKVLENQIEAAFEFFRDNGIEPILIKGWAASRKYPEKYARFFSDVDLAVAPEVYKKAFDLADKNNFIVDLHEGLRHLDTVEWNVLFENSFKEKLGQTDIRILSEEDHLRVLCVHWLTDGGQFKERLWDIYYAVENRREDFDWEKCLNVVSPTRRRWIICTIGLAHKYLDLNICGLPFEKEAENLPKWLIKAVEKEWKSSVRLRPLHISLNDWKEVLRQLKKRIPPNPIQATIESEGVFDEKPRIVYQIKSIANRTFPSADRILKTIFRRYK